MATNFTCSQEQVKMNFKSKLSSPGINRFVEHYDNKNNIYKKEHTK